KCQVAYLFNLQSHIRCTNREGIECDWSNLNPVTMSTCEIGPGAQHNMIDNHITEWNF
ncbi:hypothetical protein C8Q75DRAFT_726530, partial [Abortiporus biennis]